MKKQILILSFIALSTIAQAQSFSEIISLSLRNSSALKAAKSVVEAQKEQGQVGLTLPDPQVEAAYLIGSPQEINNRIDLTVTQEFDFATLSGSKRRVAEAEAVLLDRSLDEVALELKKNVALLLTDITYYNKRIAEQKNRRKQDEEILSLYQKLLDKGNCTILDYNKAKLTVTQIDGQISTLQAERDALLVKLQGLAQVSDIHYDDTLYAVSTILLPEKYEQWAEGEIANTPILRTEEQKIAVSKAQSELAKKETLPSFSVGYTSELVKGSNYRGLSVGVQVPLWANRNKINAAKRAQQAAEENKESIAVQQQSYYRQLFSETKTFTKVANELHQTLYTIDNTEILNKALKGGQMTITEFLLEKKYYYETFDQWLEAEYKAMRAMTELTTF